MPDHAVDAILEIFSWVGLGVGGLLALVALILRLADGTWVAVRAFVEPAPGGGQGRVVRWFGEDGSANEAPLSPDQDRTVGDRDTADVFIRRGAHNRMRLTPGSAAVRAVGLLAVGILSLGVVALVVSLILLFVRG